MKSKREMQALSRQHAARKGITSFAAADLIGNVIGRLLAGERVMLTQPQALDLQQALAAVVQKSPLPPGHVTPLEALGAHTVLAVQGTLDTYVASRATQPWPEA